MCFLNVLNTVCNKKNTSQYFSIKNKKIDNHTKKFKIIKKILNIGKDKPHNYDSIIIDLCNAQKVFHIMTKYMRIKKAKNTEIKHDLLYNELSSFKEHLKIDVFQENTTYTFTLRDLHKMWIKSLTMNDIMVPIPTKMKNPYNNIVFEPHVLYNIYFDMLFKGLSVNPLIHYYFRDNFNLSLFLKNNYTHLHEISIDEYTDEIIDTNRNMYSFVSLIKIRYPTITNNIYVNTILPNDIKNVCIDKFKMAIKYYCMFCFATDIVSLNSKIGIYENKCMREVIKINNNVFCRPYLKPERVGKRRITYQYYYFGDDNILY